MLRKYCDACGLEMDNRGTMRPQVNITVMGLDGSPINLLEFCDACFMIFHRWLVEFVKARQLMMPRDITLNHDGRTLRETGD